MPNRASTQNQLSQNGHSSSGQGLSEKLLNLSTSDKTLLSTQSKSPESVSDEWSPATHDLLDSLPRAWTRGLLYLLVAFAAIILPWAMLSQVDETGTARGRLEPKGTTFKLDAAVAGTVAEINVEEGDTVEAGEVLLELESDVTDAELQQLEKKRSGLQSRLAQLEPLKYQLMLALKTQQQQNQAQLLEKQTQVEQAQQSFDSLKALYGLQQDEKLAQVNQARQAIDSSRAASEIAEIGLAAAQEKVPRYQKAFDQGVISLDRFKEVEQLAQENAERLAQARSEISLAQSQLQEQQGNYDKILHQSQSEIEQAQLRFQEQQGSYQSLVQAGKLAVLERQEQLNEFEAQITLLKTEIAQMDSQIKSLEFQLDQRVVEAPASGTVFQLPVQSTGAVVQPGELIVEVAPKDYSLVLRARMATPESGSLEVGMPVKLKFDAYPFQDYGVVEGQVSRVSPDSKLVETAQGQVEMYELEITLEQPYIETRNQQIGLAPGQTATAEVIIRQRRVMDYILDPFKKLQEGGLDL